jgi:hypothetical protein
MSLSTGYVELNAALKILRACWDKTKDDWDDTVRQDFEENYWLPLEAQVKATFKAIDRLAPVLTRAKQECS